ncbi:MAG: thrombospondin type 3 repeat-containing protein, partial [Planctomycetota bacterium]
MYTSPRIGVQQRLISRASIGFLVLSCILVCPATLHADNHKWLIIELFSNSDGTVQFIEFVDDGDEEGFHLAGMNLSTSSGSFFTFPSDLPAINTENRRFLVATAAFAQLAGAPAPDFIIPNNFLQISGDLLVYSGSPDEVSYNLLPTDGVLSINRAGTSQVNSPTNIFNASGSVTAPSAPVDCNQNGIPDPTDIASGTSTDCDSDGVPDECDLAGNDCDANGIHDACQIDSDGDGVIDNCDGCPLDPLGSVDSDGDQVCDASDQCPGGDDGIDTDGDLIPDDCDICPLDPLNDSDGDGICGDGTNDECSDATVASVGLNPIDTTQATSSQPGQYPLDPTQCLPSSLDIVGKDIWFTYTPSSSGTAIFSTCDLTTFNTDMVIYTGACTSLVQLSCNGDFPTSSASTCANSSSEILMEVNANVQYFIRIGGWANDFGTGDLSIAFSDTTGPCAFIGDGDNDGVCDDVDICPGFDDTIDTDGDGTPDGCDPCPEDALDDVDSDGICGNIDVCPLDPDNDADGDGLCGDVDSCPLDANNDVDGDGICGDIDSCPLDADNDADGDGICGDVDSCPLDPDNDADGDGICGDLDSCPLDPDNDADGDGICGEVDSCPLDPDNDADGDGICGDLDICPLDPDDDADGDGICGDVDSCPL